MRVKEIPSILRVDLDGDFHQFRFRDDVIDSPCRDHRRSRTENPGLRSAGASLLAKPGASMASPEETVFLGERNVEICSSSQQ